MLSCFLGSILNRAYNGRMRCWYFVVVWSTSYHLGSVILFRCLWIYVQAYIYIFQIMNIISFIYPRIVKMEQLFIKEST